MTEIIKKVWKNKANGQKLITIPSRCGIEEGDHVYINKVEKEAKQNNGTGQSIEHPRDELTDAGLPDNGIPSNRFQHF